VAGNGGGNQGVGFAIPGNMARNVMDQILKNGKVTRAWLGVSIQPVTQNIAKAFHLTDNYGALIGDVTKDSPAAKSGLEAGDIILDVDGQKIEDSRTLQLRIGNMSPGTIAKLTVFRNGATREIDVKLGEMPAGAAESSGAQNNQGTAPRGISTQELTPAIASQLKLPDLTKGVVVTSVDPASPAADAGLQQGDVIQEVNRQPVTTVNAFQRAMRSRPGKDLRCKKGSSLSRNRAPYRSGGNRGIASERELIREEPIHTALIHDQHYYVRLRSADLETKASSLDTYGCRCCPTHTALLAAGNVSLAIPAKDGTEHTLHLTATTVVHGTEATANDIFHGLKEGSEVVAHLTAKGANETAAEVDKVGKEGMKAVEGTISELDRGSKKLAVKTADGAEQTFKLSDRAAEDAGRDMAKAAETSAKVTVYYTEDAGRKVAHFFETH
jgi:hypothetical protein